MNTRPRSLIEQFLDYFGLSRLVFTIAVACLLVLPLFMAVFTHGWLAVGGLRGLWTMCLEPAITVYILGINPLLKRSWALTMDALRLLADRPELVEQAQAANKHGEWTALLLGAAFSVWVANPWPVKDRWLLLYVIASNMVMFSLVAMSIYEGLVRSRRYTRIVRAGLQLDLFDRRPLTPLARWGQIVSLTFVGGICLSLLFQYYGTLSTVHSLVVYAILVVVSLTLFFTSIWSVHDALVAAQQRELAAVHQHWSRARSELKLKLAEGAEGEAARLYEPIVVLGTYESQVLAASTWPFNPKIVKEVVASVIAPLLIYGLKIALGVFGSH